MASYAAIADVSESLVELLREEITDRADVVSLDRSEIALVSPADVGSESDVRLGLYLYRLGTNGTHSTAARTEVAPDTMRDPPLALDLRYLLTAYPRATETDPSAETLAQQRLLGLAMQTFHDNAVLDDDRLRGSLGETPLNVSLESSSHEAFTALWSTFTETPYQPSVSYHVRPALIESHNEERVQRVSDPQTDLSRKPSEPTIPDDATPEPDRPKKR